MNGSIPDFVLFVLSTEIELSLNKDKLLVQQTQYG